MILGVVEEQSPDLEIKDILALGVGDSAREGLRDGSAVEEDDEEEEPAKEITLGMLARALWGTKKDSLNVIGSAVLTALLVVRLIADQDADGASWYPFLVVAWVSSGFFFYIHYSAVMTHKFRE